MKNFISVLCTFGFSFFFFYLSFNLFVQVSFFIVFAFRFLLLAVNATNVAAAIYVAVVPATCNACRQSGKSWTDIAHTSMYEYTYAPGSGMGLRFTQNCPQKVAAKVQCGQCVICNSLLPWESECEKAGRWWVAKQTELAKRQRSAPFMVRFQLYGLIFGAAAPAVALLLQCSLCHTFRRQFKC